MEKDANGRSRPFGSRKAQDDWVVSFATLDMLAANTMPAFLTTGVYTFAGNEMKFRAQSTTLPAEAQSLQLMQNTLMMQQNMNMMQHSEERVSFQQSNTALGLDSNAINLPPQQASGPIQQGNLRIIGNKLKEENMCCCMLTFFPGACLIIPLCFIKCMWWKKIVSALYELTPQAYHDVAAFIQRNPTMNWLNLAVADNSFNAEKAQILYEALSKSNITKFSFVNLVNTFNNISTEADDFIANVTPIKSLLSITSRLQWRDMIV